MSEGRSRGSGPSARGFQTAHYVLIGEVGNDPVDLARLENAVVPRAPIGVGPEAFDPEMPIIPELNRQRPAPGAPPPLKDSVGWHEKAFTIPGVRRRRAGRQHRSEEHTSELQSLR